MKNLRKLKVFVLVTALLLNVLVLPNGTVPTVEAASKKVTVKKVTSVSLLTESNKITLTKGKKATLKTTVTVTPNKSANKKVTYKSSDKKVATVSSKGVITGKKAGTAKITVISKTDSKKKATVTVKVVKGKVTGIKLNKTSGTLTVGGTETLKATVKVSKGGSKAVVWSSSNTKVATVKNGVVKAVGEGKATITVKASDGSGKKATYNVTVKVIKGKVTGIKLNKTSGTLTVGGTETLKATVKVSKGGSKAVVWSSSNTKVATVKNGVVKAVGEGKATITVKASDGSGKKATYNVTVKKAEPEKPAKPEQPELEEPEQPEPEEPEQPEHEHNFIYEKSVLPTCTEDGYDLYSCSCGIIQKENYSAALGHSFDNDCWIIIEEPTENKSGSIRAVCDRCNETTKKEITFKELYTYNYRDGGVVITRFAQNYSGEIHIPNTIEGKKVIKIGDEAFRECSSLSNIIIPDEVVSIGAFAFEGCCSLGYIELPNGVTEIGRGAFSGCSGLNDITISNGVTSIEDSAFNGCSNLNSVIIPDGVTSIGNSAFNGCSNLNSVIIPDGVTSIGNSAFNNCGNLNDIIIPDGMINIEDMAFSGCRNLEKISIPFKTNVGEGVFDRCNKLTIFCFKGSSAEERAIAENIRYDSKEATAEDYLKYDVQDGEVVIKGCYYGYPTTIDIPNMLEGKPVTSIGAGAFSECNRLTNITIPSGVTVISNSTFSNCSKLSSITIPDVVINIESFAFQGCSSLSSIVLPDQLTDIGVGAFQDCSSLSSITIPNGVVYINDGTFQGCSRLNSIVIPSGVGRIGSYTFYGCSNLSSIIISEGVDYMIIDQGAFGKCSSLTDVVIPKGVERIQRSAFDSCSSLSSMTIYNDNIYIDGCITNNCPATLVIKCNVGSTAEQYTIKYGHVFEGL